MLIKGEPYYLDVHGLREFLNRIDTTRLSKQIKKVYEEDLTEIIYDTEDIFNKDDVKRFMNDVEIHQIPSLTGLRMKDFLSSLITLTPDYLINFELNTFTIYAIGN